MRAAGASFSSATSRSAVPRFTSRTSRRLRNTLISADATGP
jgi:hypothetical protein